MQSLTSPPTSFALAFAPAVLVLLLTGSKAKVEFCLRGRQELYDESASTSSLELDTWFSDSDDEPQLEQEHDNSKIIGCSGGILFNRPFQLERVIAEDEPFCYKQSVCDEKWRCNFQKNSIVAEIIKIGKPSKNDTWLYEEGDRKMKISKDFAQCQQYGHPLNTIDFVHSHRAKRDITGLVPSEPTSAGQIQREVDDQTKRMFYYLSGINQDQVNSHLRVVKLFKMSSQLASMICDPQYISPRFLKEIERGFLFLLKEQGFDKMADLDLETYNQLKQTLEHCASTSKPVKFMGRPCPSGIKIEKVYQTAEDQIKTVGHKSSEKAFKWGEFDVVLDAAWSTMMIVHAGCFESFSGKVNLLHKFEVALEQLFHSALYIRWEHPTQLTDDTFYDSVFMAKVNDTLEAMDSCTRFLYLLTPFRLPMNRPLHETFYRRKKRSTSTESYYEDSESAGKTFASLENSIEVSGESTGLDGYAAEASSEELDYNHDRPPIFQCLKSEDERTSKMRMAQKHLYDDCRGLPKRNS